MKVKPDGLSAAIGSILEEYRDATYEAVQEAADAAAKQCLDDIRTNIDTMGLNDTGAYRKSWTSQKTSAKNQWDYGKVVYSRMPHLPHLLEHGHAKRGGGRVEGRPHIAPAEERAQQTFLQRLRAAIERGGKG